MERTINSTLTTKQIETMLRQEADRLTTAERALNEARNEIFNVERGPDHPAVKAERLKELEPLLTERERDAITAALIAEGNLQELLEQTGGDLPMLTDDDMAAANARREFVREDVNEQSLNNLIAMARRALTIEDRPALYLLTRYLPGRLTTSEATWSESGNDADVDTLRRLIREAVVYLRDGRLDPLQQKAQAMLSTANALDRNARTRERESATYRFQTGNEVKW